MKTRWAAGLAAAALLAVAAAGWAWWRQADADLAWRRIRERGVMVVATDASYPPFSAVDGAGQLFGFDVDLAEALGRELGVRVAFDNLTYDALLAGVIAGRDDVVISAFVPQPERTQEIAFSRPYFVSGTVGVAAAAARAELPDAAAWPRWLTGRRLAVEYGAGGDVLGRTWREQGAVFTLLPLPTAQEALAAVARGEAEAALVDAITAYEFLAQHPELALTGPPLDPEPYALAVSAHSRDLLAALEQALTALERSGELTRLKVKWFGPAAGE